MIEKWTFLPFYNPQIARWSAPDPMSDFREWLSPYNYCQNNPINRIDPTGAYDDGIYYDENGDEIYRRGELGGDELDFYFICYQDESGGYVLDYYFTSDDYEEDYDEMMDMSSDYDEMDEYGRDDGERAQSDRGRETPEWITNTGRGVGAFMPANTTKEVLIDYVRATGNMGKTGVKYLKGVRGASVVGSLIGVGVSGVNIYKDYDKNGNGLGDVNSWDVADASVGVAGLGVTGLVTLGLVSNPIGWGVAIGTGVYFGARLIYDIATDE